MNLRLKSYPFHSLPKYVLLNWQGESAPGTKKGICSTHLKDVAAYFRGSHLTINARNEEEVNVEDIRQQVAKVSASSYNFKERPMAAEMDEQPGPVGSNHQRIIPQKELPKLSERERFWHEEQSREKARIEEERTRKVSENARLEEERKRREEDDSKKRDAAVAERERKISRIKEEEARKDAEEAEKRAKADASKWGEGSSKDDDERWVVAISSFVKCTFFIHPLCSTGVFAAKNCARSVATRPASSSLPPAPPTQKPSSRGTPALASLTSGGRAAPGRRRRPQLRWAGFKRRPQHQHQPPSRRQPRPKHPPRSPLRPRRRNRPRPTEEETPAGKKWLSRLRQASEETVTVFSPPRQVGKILYLHVCSRKSDFFIGF